MTESYLIKTCKDFLKDCKDNKILPFIYNNETIENIIEKLLIVIDSKNEVIELHIKDNQVLYDRLSYLLTSKTIQDYDAKDGKGQYLKDIKELDKVMDKLKKKEYITGETEELKVDNSEIVITKKEYKKLIAKQYYLLGKLHGEKQLKIE